LVNRRKPAIEMRYTAGNLADGKSTWRGGDRNS
jgi:hypothetical protein